MHDGAGTDPGGHDELRSGMRDPVAAGGDLNLALAGGQLCYQFATRTPRTRTMQEDIQ